MGDVDREWHAGLGRLRRQSQSSDDTADGQGGIDVAEPQQQLLLLLVGERSLELVDECGRTFVAGHGRVTRGDHDTAQVAQVEVFELLEGRLGTVLPLGQSQLREQFFGDLHDRCLGHLGATLGHGPGVLLADACPDCSHALQGQLGDRPLLLGQLGQHRVAVGLAGPQPLRLRALGDLWRGSERGAPTAATIATAATVAGATVAGATIATSPAVTAAGSVGTTSAGGVTAGAIAATSAGAVAAATVAAPAAIIAITTWASVAIAATPIIAVALGASLDDRLEFALAREQFDHGGFGLLADLHHTQHGDAVDLLLDIDLEDVTDAQAGWQHRAADDTFGLPSAGRPPSPGVVIERAGEFDVDPSRHGAERYRLEHAQHH